jgi:hypothetical protein
MRGVLAVIVAVAVGGCSFFSTAPKSTYTPIDGPPRCHVLPLAFVDGAVVVGGYSLLAVTYHGTSDGSTSELDQDLESAMLAATIIGTAPWLIGMLVGVDKYARCRSAERRWASYQRASAQAAERP